MQPDLFSTPGGQANAWADADNDGDLDYFVGFRGRPNRFYRNDNGTFRDVAGDVGLADNQETRAAAWGDFDADGDPDLFIGFANPSVAAKVYRNERNGTRFVDVASTVGISLRGVARQPAWIDYDGDGDLDLYSAFRDVPNRLLRNDAGRFVDVSSESGIGDTRRSVSGVWWDFDRDGDLDLFVANYGSSALYRNEAGRSFTDVARASGIDLAGHGVTSAWGDLDNDGLPDLYVGNFVAGQPLYRDALFINAGRDAAAWRFAEALPDVILKHDATHGVQFVDFDADGRLDLALTNNDPGGGGHPLLRNTSVVRGRSFRVDVTDARGRRTRAGSEVRLYEAGTKSLLSAGLVDSGRGYFAPRTSCRCTWARPAPGREGRR